MKSEHLSRTYAKALYAAAESAGQADAVLEQMLILEPALRGELAQFLSSPRVKREDKLQMVSRFLQELFPGQDLHLVENFFRLLLEKGRTMLLPEFPVHFRRFRDSRDGVERGEVIVAAPLLEEALSRLQDELSKVRGTRVLLHQKIDPDVLGGFKVNIRGMQIDATLEQRLQMLKRQLLAS